MTVNLKTIIPFVKAGGGSKTMLTKPQPFQKINPSLMKLSTDTVRFAHCVNSKAKSSVGLTEIEGSYNLLRMGRSQNYTKSGNCVDVGQGCIYAGAKTEKIKSYGFDSCAPFIVLSKKSGKCILGHIDSQSTADEIVKHVKNNFNPEEIKEASYHYLRGAETFHPEKKLGDFAINTIEDALNSLGVKGKYHGQLKTGLEDVVVRENSVNVIDELGVANLLV
jgi:hypothetical protein